MWLADVGVEHRQVGGLFVSTTAVVQEPQAGKEHPDCPVDVLVLHHGYAGASASELLCQLVDHVQRELGGARLTLGYLDAAITDVVGHGRELIAEDSLGVDDE